MHMKKNTSLGKAQAILFPISFDAQNIIIGVYPREARILTTFIIDEPALALLMDSISQLGKLFITKIGEIIHPDLLL